MSIDPKEVVILCCHLNRNLFFEDSIKRLWEVGFKNVWIMQTSKPTFGKYQGPYSKYIEPLLTLHLSAIPNYNLLWNEAILTFQKELKVSKLDYQYVFLMDFDLFFTDTKEFLETLDELVEEQYDHVSRLNLEQVDRNYNWGKKNNIVEIPDVKHHDCPHKGKEYPITVPQFCTGWEIISKKLWESFTEYEFAHWGRMISGAVDRGFKMGAQKCTHGIELNMTISGPGHAEQAWGKEWFHVGRLPRYYSMVDVQKFDFLHPGHGPHLFRMGLFAKQAEIYGEHIYPTDIQKKLEATYKYVGGRDKCLKEWNHWTKGTPLEHWEKV